MMMNSKSDLLMKISSLTFSLSLSLSHTQSYNFHRLDRMLIQIHLTYTHTHTRVAEVLMPKFLLGFEPHVRWLMATS